MPAADAKLFSFPKANRLKSSLLIKEVVQQRQSVFCFPVKCFYQVMEASENVVPKIAVLVSKKRFHHAVDRNRVKRLFREAYRLHCHELSLPAHLTLNMCWMFVGVEKPTQQQVEAAAVQIFHDLTSKIASEKP